MKNYIKTVSTIVLALLMIITITITTINPVEAAQTATVKLQVVDDVTGLVVKQAGIQFEIDLMDDNADIGYIPSYATTDATGVATVTIDITGNYYITQLTAPTGYKNNWLNHYKIPSVAAGGTQTLSYDGTALTGSARINFTYEDNAIHAEALNGQAFQIIADGDIVTGDGTIRYTNGSVVDTVTTSITGSTTTITKLYYGNYIVHQTSEPNSNYIIASDQMITINSTTVKTVSITDSIKRKDITIQLTDYDTGLIIPQAGVTVSLYSGGNYVASYVTNASGLISISNIGYGKYLEVITNRPTGYTNGTDENGGYTFWVDDTYDPAVTYRNSPITGTIGIDLTCETKVGLDEAGAVFEIYADGDIVTGDGTTRYHDGELIDTVTTDASGNATTTATLYLGSYTVHQTAAPTGYVIADDSSATLTEANYNKTAAVSNNLYRRDVTISTWDWSTGKIIPDAGTEYTITDLSSYDIVGTFTTDATGVAIAPQLSYGNYRIKETHYPYGYGGYGKDFSVTVGEGNVDARVQDHPISGIININLTCETKAGLDESNGIFEIYADGDIVTGDGTTRYHDGELLDTVTTDENGNAATTAWLFLGTYTVHQVSAPTGYVIADDFNATIDYYGEYDPQHPDAVTTVSTSNNLYRRDVTVSATDFGTSKTIKETGIEYQIYDNGTLIDTITTDTSGTVTIPQLAYGDYIIKESNQPTGYTQIASEETFAVTVGEGNVEVSFENSPITGTIGIDLSCETKAGLDEDGGMFQIIADGDIVTGDGTTRYADGELIDTVTTDSTGNATTTAWLFLGTYKVHQVSAPTGYVITNDATVTLTEANYNQSAAVSNDLYRRDVTISATDSGTNKTILTAGTVFQIFDGATLIDTITTDATGTVIEPQLSYGTYRLIQLGSPTGYTTTATEETFSVTVGNGNMQATITNSPITGNIAIDLSCETKAGLDEANGIFKIYADGDIVTGDGTVRYHNGDLVDTITTDATGNATTTAALYLGSYKVHQTAAPTGYVITNDATVTLTEAIYNQSVSISNSLYRRDVTISAADAGTGKTILTAGTVFQLFDGVTLIDTITTDTTGTVTIPQLEYNDSYTVKQINAPDAYTLGTTEQTFTITTGNGNLLVKFENAPITGSVTINLKCNDDTALTPNGYKFKVYANGDIITGDGTIRYHDGELIDTITTDATGNATTTATLYLGDYTVKASNVPSKCITPDDQTIKIFYVSLDYKDLTPSVKFIFALAPVTVEKAIIEVPTEEITPTETTEPQTTYITSQTGSKPQPTLLSTVATVATVGGVGVALAGGAGVGVVAYARKIDDTIVSLPAAILFLRGRRKKKNDEES